MVLWFPPLHDIIQQSQQGFALIKTLLVVCRRFTIMKIPENDSGWNEALAHYRWSIVLEKKNHDQHHHQRKAS